MPPGKSGTERTVRQVASELLRNMRKRAKQRNLPIDDFTLEEIVDIIKNGKCAVTNRSFDHTVETKYKQCPFVASPDRIDNDKGYTRDNVRFVCYWVNRCRSNYDLDDFVNWMKGVRWK